MSSQLCPIVFEGCSVTQFWHPHSALLCCVKKFVGVVALCRESSRIRLSGFAGTSHYERGSVMDSDFWASRILLARDPSRVPVR